MVATLCEVPPLHIRMLGPFQARVGASEIPPGARRNGAARRLLLRLACALCDPGEPSHREMR
jgi:hypothetical protein